MHFLIVYNLLEIFIFIISLPVWVMALICRKKYRHGLSERLGWLSGHKINRFFGKKIIWIHAVSVGECSAVYPLYQKIKKEYSDWTFVFSTVTYTGQQWMKNKLPEEDILIYFPLDIYWITKRVLTFIRPKVIVIVETEIWPNFLWLAARMGAKACIVNGRLSDTSFRRYKWVSHFIKQLLSTLSFVSVQSEKDGQRFCELGLANDKVFYKGNLKFESSFSSMTTQKGDIEAIQRAFQLQDKVVLIGGSTHEGEEALLISCYRRLVGSGAHTLRLGLAPRHPERFKKVQSLIEKSGYRCVRSSEKIKEKWEAHTILVIDEMGKLPFYYSLASIAFIGKSFTAHGGQNLLEAAMAGAVIIYGPYMENFREIADLFLLEKAALEIHHEENLYKTLHELILFPQKRDFHASNAKKILGQNQHAVADTLQLMEHYLLCQN